MEKVGNIEDKGLSTKCNCKRVNANKRIYFIGEVYTNNGINFEQLGIQFSKSKKKLHGVVIDKIKPTLKILVKIRRLTARFYQILSTDKSIGQKVSISFLNIQIFPSELFNSSNKYVM